MAEETRAAEESAAETAGEPTAGAQGGEQSAGGVGKLVALRGDQPNGETVAILERLLARAKAGEVQQVMVATVNRDNVISTAYSSGLLLRDACFAVTVLRLRVEDLVRLGDEYE